MNVWCSKWAKSSPQPAYATPPLPPNNVKNIATKFMSGLKVVGSMSWIPIRSLFPGPRLRLRLRLQLPPSLPTPWPKNMAYDEFNALNRGLLSHAQKPILWRCQQKQRQRWMHWQSSDDQALGLHSCRAYPPSHQRELTDLALANPPPLTQHLLVKVAHKPNERVKSSDTCRKKY